MILSKDNKIPLLLLSNHSIKNPAHRAELKNTNSKSKTEIPKQVREDKKIRTKPSCHAEFVSASDLFFLLPGDTPRFRVATTFILVHPVKTGQARQGFQMRF
jgi:hypothetical protein